ncbi:MAG: hypothetical protein AB1420_13160 [Bacillota bacterium]
MNISDRAAVLDTGICVKQGDFGNLPAGEAYIGSIHVALGANHTFGGRVQVPIHLDAVWV